MKHNQWWLTGLHLIHKNLIHYTVSIVYLFLLGTLHFFYLSTLHFKDQWSKEDSWRTEDTPRYYPTKAIKTYMNEKALLIKVNHTIFFFCCGAATQRGSWPPHSWGFQITHNNAPQSVGFLWTSDQLVAETSTWQHTTITTDKYPWPPLGFEPTISAGEQPQIYALDCAATGTGKHTKYYPKTAVTTSIHTNIYIYIYIYPGHTFLICW